MNWFVSADAKAGDGTREKPFHDPWLAFRAAGPGDTIHIAAGIYYGRYDRASWLIDSPQLTVLGGYSHDFSTRTPWQSPTLFAAYPNYEYVRENNMIAGGDDHAGLTLDGLFFDASGKNTYKDPPSEELQGFPNMDGPIASFNGKKVTIKNCVFANSATGGVELTGDGSRFENNFLINILGLGMLDLKSASGGVPQLLTVTGNSFCFAHDTSGPPFGQGADNAVGLRIHCPAVVQNNLFIGCGNSAISIYRDLERLSLDNNLFYLTPHNTITSRVQVDAADITEGNLDEFEDLGPKSAGGNSVGDPGLSGLRAGWVDMYTRFLLARFAKPPKAAANALRTAAGLTTLESTDLQKPSDQGAMAPKLSPTDILAMRFTAKQGFHPVDLPVTVPAAPPLTAFSYKSIDWKALRTPDASLANQRVELRAGLGSAQNNALLADAPMDTHMAFQIYEPGADESPFFVMARRWTLVNREFEAGIKSNNGREVENTYFIRGIYRTDIQPSSRQKVTLMVESITLAPVVAAAIERPMGRDWFVKAGSSGGDGSQEKPFRDPFQALEKAEGGDSIHVAGGDYFGKLHSGLWKILVRNLTMLGGYDAEFKERDPWKNPTRFILSDEEKAKKTLRGTLLGSEENSEGLLLDGFIFDGSTYNNYTPAGSLDVKASPTDTLVELRGGRAPITVRHCVFLNSSYEALSISCPYGLFENNVVVNAGTVGLHIHAQGPGPWIIRNNTFLFASDPSDRAATGKSAPDGTLLLLMGRAEAHIESNIFAFADNFGVRASMDPTLISFDKNVFAGNLFNHLTDTHYLWADNSNWDRRAVADSDFASMQGNRLELPKLAVDAAFADKAFSRFFQLPSRISDEEWKTLAAQIGASVKPTPSAPAAETTQPVEAPKSTAGASLADLMASLGGMTGSTAKPATSPSAADTLFCPIYDWKKALDLAQENNGPGAHKEKITVSFSAAAPKADVQYEVVLPQQMDGALAAFDNKPIQIDVKTLAESSNNPGLYPPGLTNDNYAAYYVSESGDYGRTRVSLLVKMDTAATKIFSRVGRSDTLRVRGTARVIRDPGAVAIIVDNAQLAEPSSS